MNTNRAHALIAALLLSSISLSSCTTTAGDVVKQADRPLLIATWPFGKAANDEAMQTMLAGGSALDGVEQGIRLIESLGSDGSVGLAGRPNAAGYAQLDACIMNGPDRNAGSVGAIEGIVHPITAARRVMENSRHVMLVGEGARWFALEQGLESVDVAEQAALKKAWVERAKDPVAGERGHDTIAVLALDMNGDIAGGCSTSGAGGKLPGRVGDSPILGAGLYIDNDVGAAGATGLGENVMRYCATAMIVELMRQGMHPKDACEEMIHRIAGKDPLGYELSISFIALDKQGRYGAASSNGHFPHAVASRTSSEVISVGPVTRR